MPSQSFSGKSKEDLVIVARLSGLLSEDEAQRMTRTELARFLETARDQAEKGLQQSPGTAASAVAADTATAAEKPARKTGGRRRKAGVADEAEPGSTTATARVTAAAPEASAEADPSVEAPAGEKAASGRTATRKRAAAAKPVTRTRKSAKGGTPASGAEEAPAGPAAPLAETADAAGPEAPARAATKTAGRAPRRTAARKADTRQEPLPEPAAQTDPVVRRPDPAAEGTPAETPAGHPVAGPAELNAIEPVEPTIAQAIASGNEPSQTARPAAEPPAMQPAAAPADLNALEPHEPTIAQAATPGTETAPAVRPAAGQPAAEFAAPAPRTDEAAAARQAAAPRYEQPRKRVGRPPKNARPPVAAEPVAPARPERPAFRAGPGPGALQPGRPAGQQGPMQGQRQPQGQPGQGQPTGRHERPVRMPGKGPHHSFIPAHHTLTPPAGGPDAERAPWLDQRPEGQAARPEGAAAQAENAARTDGFQERQPAGQGYQGGQQAAPAGSGAPSGFQDSGRAPGAPFQQQDQSGPQFNASGRVVRPSSEGYGEGGEPALYGDGQPAGPGVQPRTEAEGGKHRRPFVETGEMVSGVLEIMPDGYGFLRKENYLQGSKDIYVPPQYIRRFNLRQGDLVAGPGKVQRETDRYQALLYIKEVNGLPPEQMIRRPNFDKLTPIYPDERFLLETNRTELSTRIIDLVAPIGKGQRGMIVSPPKAGKTILLQKIANAISINNPDVKLIVLLIDERPEEVTDMQRSINGEVVYSTFDKTPENHVKVTELVLERAMRLVELNQDVVILLDSITRMGRAYNLTINPTGRTLSGGLDPGALYGPKRFFGAARNIEGGGSLTIIATALIDTGSRMDEVIFEEFKGTGNMEVYLDRRLSEKRIFPAIDINRSGTRREELLLTGKELDAVWSIRKAFSQLDTSSVTEMIINLLMKTNNNQHFVSSINVSLNDKNVFEAMRGNRPGQSQNGHSG